MAQLNSRLRRLEARLKPEHDAEQEAMSKAIEVAPHSTVDTIYDCFKRLELFDTGEWCIYPGDIPEEQLTEEEMAAFEEMNELAERILEGNHPGV
jgi:hypothetical protein